MSDASIQAVFVKCLMCNHVWKVCDLPMPMSKAARLMKKAYCPQCHEEKQIVMSYPPADWLAEFEGRQPG